MLLQVDNIFPLVHTIFYFHSRHRIETDIHTPTYLRTYRKIGPSYSEPVKQVEHADTGGVNTPLV